MRTIVWFRDHDLRVADHAPLASACEGEVVPVFVLEPDLHRSAFMLSSLCELAESIARLGSRLFIVYGRSAEIIPSLADRWQADRVVAHRRTAPAGRDVDERVASAMRAPLVLFEGETLVAPGAVRTKEGNPYSVFGPFARAHAEERDVGKPLAAPRRLPPIPRGVTAVEIPPSKPSALPGGERAGKARLERFAKIASKYAADRDRLDRDHTSRLSADLRFGTLSVRTIWNRLSRNQIFAKEIVWREFAHAMLWTRPWLLERPFRAEWTKFPWRDDERAWRAWRDGTTGYPIIDAAARQLLSEGFVPNRARMIAASFLTKHLLIDFRRGEAHYMKHLVDGDVANNDLNWQWCAGCGCDAQPWFRVFNPTAQAARFDPTGAYVSTWAPKKSRAPIVDHAEARARFLAVAKKHLTGTGDGTRS
jgi:deoxyribodipyrimidine photo-lyase